MSEKAISPYMRGKKDFMGEISNDVMLIELKKELFVWFIVLLFCTIYISEFTDQVIMTFQVIRKLQVIMNFVTHLESSASSFPSG